MSLTVSSNYSGRQVDVELLQSIVSPGAEQQVHVSSVYGKPKITAGVEKALQRYTVLLLTSAGDVKFASTQGTSLLKAVLSGMVTNKGTLVRLFGLANSSALAIMAADNLDTSKYGTIPDDERIASVELTDTAINYQTSTLALTLTFTMRSGTDLEFIIPVTTVRT